MSPMARLAQSVERKALNVVVVGSSPTVGVLCALWSVTPWADGTAPNKIVDVLPQRIGKTGSA